MAVPPSMNNTTKTSIGEDLLKIRLAVAEQSRQKRRKNKIKKNII